MVPVCSSIGTPRLTAPAPSSPPVTAARLQQAWKELMMLRP